MKQPHGYDAAFFAEQRGAVASALPVAAAVAGWVRPCSVVDVGCGVGSWLAAFRAAGVGRVLGLDGDYVDRSQLLIPAADFRPLDLASDLAGATAGLGRFDLAVSLEVGEHLPASRAGGFVGFLTSLAPVVLFSAAVPGQGGTHHVNEQWPRYWQAHFSECGYDPVDVVRPRFWSDPAVGGCYKQNAFLYVARGRLGDYPELASEAAKPAAFPPDAVHPDVFSHALRRRPSLRQLLREIPVAARAAVSRIGR